MIIIDNKIWYIITEKAQEIFLSNLFKNIYSISEEKEYNHIKTFEDLVIALNKHLNIALLIGNLVEELKEEKENHYTIEIKLTVLTKKPFELVANEIKKGIYKQLDSTPYYVASPKKINIINIQLL